LIDDIIERNRVKNSVDIIINVREEDCSDFVNSDLSFCESCNFSLNGINDSDIKVEGKGFIIVV